MRDERGVPWLIMMIAGAIIWAGHVLLGGLLAGAVVVAGGAIQSPAILLRSGVEAGFVAHAILTHDLHKVAVLALEHPRLGVLVFEAHI